MDDAAGVVVTKITSRKSRMKIVIFLFLEIDYINKLRREVTKRIKLVYTFNAQ